MCVMAVFAAAPPPRVTCLSCALEVGKMRALWSSSVLFPSSLPLPGTRHPCATPLAFRGQEKVRPGLSVFEELHQSNV